MSVPNLLVGELSTNNDRSDIQYPLLKPWFIMFPADIQKRARLADFGISRRLPKGQTTHRTSSAGTKCWKAKETLDEDEDDVAYKRSTDIQVVVFF